MKNLSKLFLCCLIFLSATEAHAQNRRVQLLFARHCVNETGFNITDDAPAMADVLRQRSSTGIITAGIIRAYSRDTVVRRHEIRNSRRYISFLNPLGRQPSYWNEDSTVPWFARRRIWLQIYERAGKILRREVQSNCEELPDHWGASSMHRRVLRRGWREVDCGDTFNRFYIMRRR